MSEGSLDELLLCLGRAGVRFVVIGGIAVGVHGYVRGTKDVDVCPDPDPENLRQLAALLTELEAEQLGVGDLEPDELPMDPRRVEDLAQGGNFRLRTRLGDLDVMQWVAGIEGDHAYAELATDAMTVSFRDITLTVCSLAKLRQMKEAAGRPQDKLDLEHLPAGTRD